MSRPITSSWWMKVPFSSAAPARSASPSSSRPKVVAALGQDAERLVDVRRDRLRVHAAEPRVALGVDLRHPDLAARQHPRDPARAGAPHRLHEDVHVGGLQPLDVQRALGVLDVARVRVVQLDLARGERVRVRTARLVGCRRCRGWSSRRRPACPGWPRRRIGDFTLKPLSWYGLWEAVIMIPHAAPRSTTSYEVICVGTAVCEPWRPGCRRRAAPRRRPGRRTRTRSGGRRR